MALKGTAELHQQTTESVPFEPQTVDTRNSGISPFSFASPESMCRTSEEMAATHAEVKASFMRGFKDEFGCQEFDFPELMERPADTLPTRTEIQLRSRTDFLYPSTVSVEGTAISTEVGRSGEVLISSNEKIFQVRSLCGDRIKTHDKATFVQIGQVAEMTNQGGKMYIVPLYRVMVRDKKVFVVGVARTGNGLKKPYDVNGPTVNVN